MHTYTRTFPPPNFYVYAYFDSEGACYYIGKGQKDRAWAKHGNVIVPKDKSKICICEANLTEIGAWAIERRLIRWYGMRVTGDGKLVNKSLGGGGSPGYTHTAHAISKMKQKTFTDEWRKTQSEFMRENNPHQDPIVAEKISKALTGRVFSENHRKNIGKSNSGKVRSVEFRNQVSAAMKGVLRGPQDILVCPHCGKSGGESNMKRYHFDRCKLKKT